MSQKQQKYGVLCPLFKFVIFKNSFVVNFEKVEQFYFCLMIKNNDLYSF
jgi:hypothetical protein